MLHVLYIMINISCPRKRIKNRGMSCNLCGKTTNDAIKFSYHFLLSDAQPNLSGTFHQDFTHIAQAR